MINNLVSKLNFIYCLKVTFLLGCVFLLNSCDKFLENEVNVWTNVQTFAGLEKEFEEPFGIAVKGKFIFVSDGEKGTISKIDSNGKIEIVTDKLDTPSQIVFNDKGELLVADSGSHTIKKILSDGKVELVAGIENKKGFKDGAVGEAIFNAPIGITVYKDKIYVADTYNDKIRLIEKGKVNTIAGDKRGFTDGKESNFDTPTGLAAWVDGKILVADTGNSRIRVVEENGETWTLSGNDNSNLIDGLLSEAEFVQPTALTVDKLGTIYVADGNAIRAIGRRLIPIVETVSNDKHGFFDGEIKQSRFNRPSGLITDERGNLLVTDSENQLIRAFTNGKAGQKLSVKDFDKLQTTAEEFRKISKPSWTYDPPEKEREIAGTLGEIRGELKDEDSRAWFHNGLDIVGGYGESAHFIRDEKVLRPIAVSNFETTRELLRMPTLGYIHIRMGRDRDQKLFEDDRFQFDFDEEELPIDVRIPRGTKFKAGDKIGTLNRLNHVHLVAGGRSNEMNALDALILPDASDKRIPKIQNVSLYDKNWSEIETEKTNERIKLQGKVRIVVQAFDQMDGNAERRKLGVYKIGYQILNEEKEPIKDFKDPKWTIKFDKLPDNYAVKLVYAKGSKSGATGETVFKYIATNEVSGRIMRENFLNVTKLEKGNYILRVLVADFFGNSASEDIEFQAD